MDQKMEYREFQAKANSREIQCEHHLAAGLFVCGKFALAGTPGYRVVEGADPYKIHEIPVRGASKTLRCQRCGVAPPPTGLREVFCTFRLFANQITHFFESPLPTFFQESRRPAFSKSFPSIRKPNNTFFLKVLWFSAFG